MKKFMLLLILLSVVFFVACDDDEEKSAESTESTYSFWFDDADCDEFSSDSADLIEEITSEGLYKKGACPKEGVIAKCVFSDEAFYTNVEYLYNLDGWYETLAEFEEYCAEYKDTIYLAM